MKSALPAVPAASDSPPFAPLVLELLKGQRNSISSAVETYPQDVRRVLMATAQATVLPFGWNRTRCAHARLPRKPSISAAVPYVVSNLTTSLPGAKMMC